MNWDELRQLESSIGGTAVFLRASLPRTEDQVVFKPP